MTTTIEDVNSDALVDKDIDTAKEKQSTRTFTQSEADKLVKSQVEAVASKYSDYDEKVKELEELKQKQIEREEAELSELEKIKRENEKLAAKVDELNGVKTQLERETLKQRVLNDPKFSELPTAYKKLVELGDDEESIRISAEKQLEEFKSDFKIKTDFGIPSERKKDDPIGNSDISREALKQKMRDRMKR